MAKHTQSEGEKKTIELKEVLSGADPSAANFFPARRIPLVCPESEQADERQQSDHETGHTMQTRRVSGPQKTLFPIRMKSLLLLLSYLKLSVAHLTVSS